MNSSLSPAARLGAIALAASAVAFAAPAHASAPDAIFDTGTPAGATSGLGLTVSTVDWLAEEVHLDANTTIGGLSTFLVGAEVGETFTIALYGDRVKANGTEVPDTTDGSPLFSTQVTFTGNGWNGTQGLAWRVAQGGNYWFSVQVNDGDTLAATDNAYLPVGVSTLPLSVAYTDSNPGHFVSLGNQSSSYAFGLQVSAVPEPASVLLMMAGLSLLLATKARRGSTRR